jgi:replicative DNA helicase
MSVVDIEMYLEKTPSLYAIYERNKGTAFLESVSEIIDIDKFDYYFNRMKKFTLLRNLDKCGVNVKKFYDPDEILDQKKINSQNTWLELTSVEEMANEISDNIQKVIDDSVASTLSVNCQAGDGVRELINRFKQAPEVGIPMYGDMMNTIFRGCRLKKFYLRSAPSGQGKVIAV